ncbi:transposase [Paraburkholderia atlantica]|uniref:Transposase n=1 Tax=Paraburkholderia atlantica TaxID=2654982 RepID=A0A7W8QFR0_PARAM|nr:transposase [Paraburkholderia atlantica]
MKDLPCKTSQVGIDPGKHAFHLHGQDAAGQAVFRRKVSRKQLIEFFATLHPCTVVMEACAGAHCMARKIAELGHESKLISLQFVRPFVKSNKNDFVDAEAICEAASRPSMRFVTTKTVSQQTLSALHRVRDSLVRDKVCATNQMHGFLLEFGVTLPVGNAVVRRLPVLLAEHSLPPRLVAILERLHAHFKYLSEQIGQIEKELNRQLADDAIAQRLLTTPGVVTITASLLASELGDGKQYRWALSGWARVPVPWTRLCIFDPNRFAEGVPPVQQVGDDYAFAFLRRKLLRQQAFTDAALDARDLCLDQRAHTVAVLNA